MRYRTKIAEREGTNERLSNVCITVDLKKPSYYHAPGAGSLRDYLRRLRMYLNYRHYKNALVRFGRFNPEEEKKILEVGCGPGYLLNFLGKLFPQWKITGLDFDQRLLDEAATRARNSMLIHGNAERLPFCKSQFDALISLHNIEHLYRPERFIAEAYRVLEPGGVLLLATPNPHGIGAKLMGQKWGGYREDHVSLKPPNEWRFLLKQEGFTPLQERTTLLTGIPAFRWFPLNLVNWGLLVLFGAFPWKHGEAYVSVWRKD